MRPELDIQLLNMTVRGGDEEEYQLYPKCDDWATVQRAFIGWPETITTFTVLDLEVGENIHEWNSPPAALMDVVTVQNNNIKAVIDKAKNPVTTGTATRFLHAVATAQRSPSPPPSPPGPHADYDNYEVSTQAELRAWQHAVFGEICGVQPQGKYLVLKVKRRRSSARLRKRAHWPLLIWRR